MPSAAFASVSSTFWNQLRWLLSLPPSTHHGSLRLSLLFENLLLPCSNTVCKKEYLIVIHFPIFAPSILSISFFSLPSILSFILYGIPNSLRLFENLPFFLSSFPSTRSSFPLPDSHMRLRLNASGENKNLANGIVYGTPKGADLHHSQSHSVSESVYSQNGQSPRVWEYDKWLEKGGE